MHVIICFCSLIEEKIPPDFIDIPGMCNLNRPKKKINVQCIFFLSFEIPDY